MATKKEQIAQEVARAVGAGKPAKMKSVDFGDPSRKKTCLEVDFPILPVNSIAALEATTGATKKPIYQLSKWWARRQPSVFRTILLAAAASAPDDAAQAARLVWDNYYANHQQNGAFQKLKVADIFMGGGTTLIEGSRLGMSVVGNDLNPVAWFVVKQELADVDLNHVKGLLADIEAEVKPQLMPYFFCDGPSGEKGTWTHKPSNRVMPDDFDPLAIPLEERQEYAYSGPEIIYSFWSKHGPCQVTGCGHRTPIMPDPVVATKTLQVRYWDHVCAACSTEFHVEEKAARIAPSVPLFVASEEHPHSVLDKRRGAICPHCGHSALVPFGKGEKKKIELALLVHPQWLAGSRDHDADGNAFGGSAQDGPEATARWNLARTSKLRLLEVRGTDTHVVADKLTGELKNVRQLPTQVTCPETGITFFTDVRGGTAALKDKRNKSTGDLERDPAGIPLKVVEKSSFACGADGAKNDVLEATKATGKTGAIASYAIHGYSASADSAGDPYNGRFFAPMSEELARQYNAAVKEWDSRKDSDLAAYWPRSKLSPGWKTHGWGIPDHGFTHYWTMFNPRQLLVHASLLKAIATVGDHEWKYREFVLAAYQQYLRNQCSFSIWDFGADQLSPALSNNNFHTKNNTVENNVFGPIGRGNWHGCIEGLEDTLRWHDTPWDNASNSWVAHEFSDLKGKLGGKTTKIYPGDRVRRGDVSISCESSTNLPEEWTGQFDLVVTDPPFGGILQYAELSDFFYVWLRLVLKDKYSHFDAEYTPKAVEVVSNPFREGDDSDGFYQRLLTQCWREAHRILKPGGLLTFTFHHSEDEPWISVLESLFDAGFYLEAAYPVRSDETKGETAAFGSQKVEYDIIHVCRKRTEEPKPVSWGRMRREVMADVRQLQAMLENHAKEGLPAADLQVIRRGKALEYFSRHYGKVYVDEGRTISVRDALVGINQLIDEDADNGKEAPPVNAEPITRQFLRTFGNAPELKRDQLQKFLRGSITTPVEFVQRGWCAEKNKVFTRTGALEFAREWSGKHRRKLTSDLDQALVLIGACFDGSGINASDTLKNENFKPHVALKPLLEWLHRNGPDQTTRNAASRAVSIHNAWHASQAPQAAQVSLFDDDGEYEQ
ncbi:DUF1156 domain-containing protein [Caenimonas sedimenti]|uniref:DUF1156 domain-containing protein n=1 Tax=Caenimonas sedimenti TaxID=2596921 RepID=A0A562ZL50_9BURK|nr:DUF1156 domain-containing protein [Caenimonas sedimenti]TWO69117.1 DUF1156 domain-containing protein [Caenimonas sedimenti]